MIKRVVYGVVKKYWCLGFNLDLENKGVREKG